ncbi:hypothetical protein D3C71_151960 [compost metagenome]
MRSFICIISSLLFLFSSCGQVTEQDVKELKKTVKKKIAESTADESFILDFTAEPKMVQMYWRDEQKHTFKSFDSLDQWLQSDGKSLRFAMNGGMYMEDNSPLGLYIDNRKTLRKLNTRSGKGNFYLKPNGVFYTTRSGKAGITLTEKFKPSADIRFATQSGPMLVIEGKIHTAFDQASQNVNIRNGVGILPDGKVLFAMSKSLITFYDFARYFQEKGCKYALYLDGGISKTYLPEQGYTDKTGDFGVIIGVIK